MKNNKWKNVSNTLTYKLSRMELYSKVKITHDAWSPDDANVSIVDHRNDKHHEENE